MVLPQGRKLCGSEKWWLWWWEAGTTLFGGNVVWKW